MRRWFLSYNSRDLFLAQHLADRLKALPDTDLFFAPASLRAGSFWLPTLADEVNKADAFLLIIAESGLGPWQILEYYEALDRRVKEPAFPIIVLLLQGQTTPGLPFLRQLNWIVEPDLTAQTVIARIQDAVAGQGSRPGELWRYTNPYRGLAAMREEDSAFFFGREAETCTTLQALADHPGCLPLLIGNSGVGKSSLAQAGIIAALERQALPSKQAFPDLQPGAADWHPRFRHSRRWAYLVVKPGTDPLKALVEPFLDTWQLDPTDPKRETRQNEWIAALLEGNNTLGGLLDATERRLEELGQAKPPAFLLYIDQGEELYIRSEERRAHRFSQVLAHGLLDPRLFAFMSLRADFLGALQNDTPLFQVRHHIDVPPLREGELLKVVSQPAERLGATFETDYLARDLARRTAEESVRDAGALPLLSYLLEDMWAEMVKRGDGVLRTSTHTIELGGVLAHRADEFLKEHPEAHHRLRRILTLKLASVREDGEPTRRRAGRAEFDDPDWQLVSALAGDPYRLLVTATPEGREPYAEIAHEALFRRWQTLRDWITAEREFLVWKAGLEADRQRWEKTPEDSALLRGLALRNAQSWLASHAEKLGKPDRDFIARSTQRAREEQEARRRAEEQLAEEQEARRQTELTAANERAEAARRLAKQRRSALWAAIAASLILTALTGLFGYQWIQTERQRAQAESQRRSAEALHKLAQERGAQAQLTQSLFLADQANQHTKSPQGGAETATLLALEALPDVRNDRERRPYAPEAEAALSSAYEQLTKVAPLRSHTAPLLGVVFSPNGTRVLTTSYDKTARIWDAQTGKELHTLRGHTSWVESAVYSPDGTHILTASNDNTARIWDAQTGKELHTLRGHTEEVASAVFSPDGTRVLTASSDTTARVWDAQTGKGIRTLRGHTSTMVSAVFSPDGTRVLTASFDNTARIWDTQTGTAIHTLWGHTDWMRSAVFSSDGTRVLTACDDKTARIWDAQTGKELRTLRGHTDRVRSAVFSPDGTRVLTASTDNTARIWDTQTGTAIYTLQGHTNVVLSVVFSPDGTRILTISHDHTARIWDAQTGKEIRILQGHTDSVVSAVFSLDGTRVLTASDDNTARIWDAQTDTEVNTLQGHTDVVESAMFSPDRIRILTASADNTARIWDAQTGKEIHTLQGHTDRVRSAVFNLDGTRVLTASADKTARIWDAQTGKEIHALQGHTEWVRSAVFSPDGTRILTASADKTARIWDTQTGTVIHTLQGHTNAVLNAVFSPDGTRILTASGYNFTAPSDNTARIWDAQTGKEIHTLQGHTNWVISAVFSPDGTHVLTASFDNTARIWDAQTGKEIHTLQGHTDVVESAVFSPDGTRILTASGYNFTNSPDKTARIWDAQTGKEIHTLQGHTEGVRSAVFSPDGTRVLTASADKTARIWDAQTGKEIRTLEEHTDSVTSTVFSPDGTRVLTASADKTARIWPVFPTTQALIDAAKARVTHCLTREQRSRAFLDPTPPDWCVEAQKWPYDTKDWQEWLRYKRQNAQSPLPDTAEWAAWMAAMEAHAAEGVRPEKAAPP